MSGFGMSALFLLVRKNLRRHLLSTAITALSIALAAGLVMSVFVIKDQARSAFTGGPFGFDAVVGARGSQLQLVLNTVFHLETSPGNIPWSLYQQVKNDPRVDLAVPYALGDNFRGFRLVGTTTDIFERFEYRPGEKFEFQSGRPFNSDRREAVVGSYVAEQTGLQRGQVITPYHGLNFREEARHDEEYVVAGILEPSNTPSDRVIWIPIEGIFRMEGHVLRGGGGDTIYRPASGESIPDEHKEVSAVMLKLTSPQAGFTLDQMVNRQGQVATLAWPVGRVMAELFNKIGWMHMVLEAVAYLVVVVAAGGILSALYNTMNERRREFATLRALGASRRLVSTSIILESGTISAIGAGIGFAVYAAIMTAAANIIRAQTGVHLEPFAPHIIHIVAPLAMIAVGCVAGIIPAVSAYRSAAIEQLGS